MCAHLLIATHNSINRVYFNNKIWQTVSYINYLGYKSIFSNCKIKILIYGVCAGCMDVKDESID